MTHPAEGNTETKRFADFREFYPYYLSEHANLTCRRLHFIGTSLVIGVVVAAILRGNPMWLLWIPLAGYGFAWIGHFFFEKNKPATFKYPFYSFAGDWAMYWVILRGKIRF